MKIVYKSLYFLLIFVFVFNIFSVAQIVSNDGSTFVTQAEFDMTKNEIKDSINKYQDKINDKVDSAIEAYLSSFKLINEEEIQTSSSILTYPITIYNDEYDYTITKWRNQTGTSRWWKPGTDLVGIFSSAGNTYQSTSNAIITEVYKMQYDPYGDNKINLFYNLTNIDTTNGVGILDGVLKDFKCTNKYSSMLFIRNGWNPWGATYGIGVRLDQSEGNQLNGVSSATVTNVRTNGRDLFNTNECPSIPLISYYDANSHTWTYTANTNFETWRTSGGNCLYNRYSNLPSTADLLRWAKNAITTNYDKQGKLQKLFTGANRNSLVPVSYNNSVYYTNYKSFKQDIVKDSKASCESHAYRNNSLQATSGKNPKLISVIDAGWCLEAEGNSINTSRNWYQQSLIRAHHIKYNVTLPVQKTICQQSILDGILITDVPNFDIDAMKITVNIHKENNNKKRYIIVSKEPISQSNPDSLVETNLLYLYNTNECNENSKTIKYELNEGINNVYFKNVKYQDKIYFKIIWDNTDESYTSIVETPKVSIFK